jgi:hypothetical protein
VTCDIVIKSYPRDGAWLQFCLKSIQKYAKGFNDILVLWPRSGGTLPLTKEKVVYLDCEENYMTQQIAKLNADLHTQADFILHFDSDCVFTKTVTPETFMVNTKPRWLFTQWGGLEPKDKLAWYHVMARCLQESPPAEFMRKSCIIVPRWAYAAFRGFIQTTHGCSMEDYILRQSGREFSEFNCLGFYLWLHHREEIEWHDTELSGVPNYGDIQHWSYAGITPNVRKMLEEATA